MSRFQIQLERLEEAWNDTLIPLLDLTHAEVRQYTQSVSADERQAMSATQILTAVNERRQAHMQKVPLTKNLIGLLFVPHAELTVSIILMIRTTSPYSQHGDDMIFLYGKHGWLQKKRGVWGGGAALPICQQNHLRNNNNSHVVFIVVIMVTIVIIAIILIIVVITTATMCNINNSDSKSMHV